MTVHPYTYVKVSTDRYQVNQGAQFVGLRTSGQEAQETCAKYNAQELAYGNTLKGDRK